MAASDFAPPVSHGLTALILNGATTSAEIDLAGHTLVGLLMPAAFTGASVKFTGSNVTGGTFVTLYDAGADLSITVAASKFVVLDPSKFAGVRFLKLVSASAEGADRTIILATRPV